MGVPFCRNIESGPPPTYTFHPAAFFGGFVGWTRSVPPTVETGAGGGRAASSPPLVGPPPGRGEGGARGARAFLASLVGPRHGRVIGCVRKRARRAGHGHHAWHDGPGDRIEYHPGPNPDQLVVRPARHRVELVALVRIPVVLLAVVCVGVYHLHTAGGVSV